jgi:type IV secretion system protein VirB3
MAVLERDSLFVALTRPQLFAGVTYSLFIANLVLATELFLLLRSAWVLAFASCFHIVAAILSVREPRIFDLWLARASKCPRVPNYRVWGCNSYQP